MDPGRRQSGHHQPRSREAGAEPTGSSRSAAGRGASSRWGTSSDEGAVLPADTISTQRASRPAVGIPIGPPAPLTTLPGPPGTRGVVGIPIISLLDPLEPRPPNTSTMVDQQLRMLDGATYVVEAFDWLTDRSRHEYDVLTAVQRRCQNFRLHAQKENELVMKMIEMYMTDGDPLSCLGRDLLGLLQRRFPDRIVTALTENHDVLSRAPPPTQSNRTQSEHAFLMAKSEWVDDRQCQSYRAICQLIEDRGQSMRAAENIRISAARDAQAAVQRRRQAPAQVRGQDQADRPPWRP